MKKLFTYSFLLCFLIQGKAQFVNSIGITVGVGAGNQKFLYTDPVGISRKKYIAGFNASVFGEFFSHDYIRWVTEIQYDQKGSIDKRPEGNYGNSLQYLSWNNYAKIRYEMYNVIPYVMIGPKLEYRLTQAETSPDATGAFKPLHVSAALGGGLEFVSYTNFKFFVEAFYNPDVSSAYVTPPLRIRNKNIELRVGLKYEFGRKESCNTPTYMED
ncbi:MAG: outer membrane beta-barrel protein [Bacteroidia bacterium]